MTSCAIVGSGNIGTDLMYKVERSPVLDLAALVGVDPNSAGLKLAADLGVESSSTGIDWIREHGGEIDIVFEATSASIHRRHAPEYERLGIVAIDLTPAKVGPAVVPGINLDRFIHAENLNMITCGGQATTPIVAAVAGATRVPYAEIVSTVASISAGPGTRANIDEFTRTTSQCLEEVGGAGAGKALMVLNPAEPPIMMRNTVFCGLEDEADEEHLIQVINDAVQDVRSYVSGYRLKSQPVFEPGPFNTPGGDVAKRVVVLLEVSGAADYLPAYAGNLDIMTAAAVRVGEAVANSKERDA